MPTEFKIPELGENITSGDVVRLLVNPGDTIAKDQPVLELETDKATIEVPSSVSGTIKDISVKQGDKVKVGQTVLTVDDGAAQPAKGADKPAAAQSAKAEKAGGAKPKPQPEGAPEEGGLSQRAPEQTQQAGDNAARRAADERESGKGETEGAQQEAGAQRPRRGEVVDISRGTRPATAAPAAEETPKAPARPAAPAAPSVRRLARELGVEISSVAGTGPEGRISADDVQAYVRSALSGGAAAPAQGGPLPDFTKWGQVERRAMSNIRRKTSEHLSRAWNTIPHVTQHDKADITAIEALRKQYAPQAEQAGGKLTVTAIALKVVAAAMRRFPQFNASVDAAHNEIVYKTAIHVGVAVDTDRGLLVPVIRDVDRKGIFELSSELAHASEKARAGKLSLEEMQGGGFTITNLGGIGGTAFTPIVNWPEVAILGMSRSAYEPFWNGEAFEPRLMLPLSLSYDHRLVDGADAARFLRWVCDAFEQPLVLAL
jgi:pyruvate dehydrogenase E2 component (dihydrolipoamide acetyltransferase)